MFTRTFWQTAAERAVRTAAQFAATVLAVTFGAGVLTAPTAQTIETLLAADLGRLVLSVLLAAVLGALVSVLTSLGFPPPAEAAGLRVGVGPAHRAR